MRTPVLAISSWPSNAELIADCARLGYLRPEWKTLDPTYGLGVFWKKWRPDTLVAHDLDPSKSLTGQGVDFCHMPHGDESFDAVVFDPPYKLHGALTPNGMEHRYGLVDGSTWRDVKALMDGGVGECARVLNGVGYLLVKCQDQVSSGEVRWQTDWVTDRAEACGLEKVDRLDYLSYRAQPTGTSQVHARRNSSQLLVFKRERRRKVA